MFLPNSLRGDLVGGDAGVDVRAFGLLGMDAGEPGGARARMVARAIAERAAVDLRQAAEHQSMFSRNGSSGFMVRRELEARALGRRESSAHDDPVRDVDEARRTGGFRPRWRRRKRRNHRIQQRQRQGGAQAAQERAAGQMISW